MRFQALERCVRSLSVVGLLGAAVVTAPGLGALAADSLFNVAKVTVDVTAKDAVAARAAGMAEAQMRAMTIVLGRLLPPGVQEQLPELTKEEVEQMVIGVAVRKEQASTTRYIATLDVNFNEPAVKRLLAAYAVPFSENRAPTIFILPLMQPAGTGEGEAVWRQAWEDLDLSHSVTPATLLPLRTDVDPGTVAQAASGDRQALATLNSAYGYGSLLLAVGQVKDGTFTTRLVGEDGVGVMDFTQSESIGGDEKAAVRKAAATALAILDNRWKVMRSGGEMPAQTVYEESPPPGMEEAPEAPAVVPRNVVALVEFSGLKDWQEIRSRLAQMAGLQALEVNSLSARTAAITFDFAGSLDTLQAALGQNGFMLDERNGTFVLRSQ